MKKPVRIEFLGQSFETRTTEKKESFQVMKTQAFEAFIFWQNWHKASDYW